MKIQKTKRRVKVNGRIGHFTHFIIKGPNQAYGFITYNDGTSEQVHSKQIKFF